MGKIDDMRRLREAQHGATTGDAPPRPSAEVAKRTTSETAEPEGRCSACGKMRPLQNGLVANHQKGLGKACPGSRKAPT